MFRATILILCFTIAACGALPIQAADPTVDKPEFKEHVLPIFEAKCIRCHGARRRDGKLDMRTLDAIREGGVSGSAVKPGNSKKSLLIELIHYDEMPPRKQQPRVTPAELDLLRAWIDQMKS